MSQHYRVEKAIDQAIGRRILSTCWLLAGLGVSIFQMLLLAQAWSLNQQAFVPACLASAWVLGAVVGMRLRADARLLGSCLVLCALLWLESILLADDDLLAHTVGTPVCTRSVGATSGNDQHGLACPVASLVTCR